MRFENVTLNFIERNCPRPRFVYWEGDDVHGTRLSRSGAKALIESLVTEIDECDGVAHFVLCHLGSFRSLIDDILEGKTDETIRYSVAAFARFVDESICRLNEFSPAAVWSTKDFQHTLRTNLPEVFIGNAECVNERQIIELAPIFNEAAVSFERELESFIDWLSDRRVQICNVWTTYDAAIEEFINRAKRKQKRAERRARRYARNGAARKAF